MNEIKQTIYDVVYEYVCKLVYDASLDESNKCTYL